jgi:secreted Zn-dependent insulinase-like peptidase
MVKYFEDTIKPNNMKFNGLLNIPQLNKYIVKNKKMLKDKTDDVPCKILTINMIDCYLKKNMRMNSTDTEIFIQVQKHDIYNNPMNYVMYLFMTEFFNLFFSSSLYEINNANNRFAIILNKTNYLLKITGYYKNIVDILNIVLDKMKELSNKKLYTETHFKHIKDKILKSIRNKKFDAPYSKIFNYQNENIYNKYYNLEVLEDTINNLNSIDNIIQLNPFEYTKIILYCEGNINIRTFNNIVDVIKNNFKHNNIPIEDINFNDKIVNTIVDKKYILQNENEENECVLVNIYINNLYNSTNWIEEYACMLIFHNLISREFFDRLRTKEQLGYIVRSEKNITGKVNKEYTFYEFLVQSNKKNGEYLKKRIFKFITEEIIDILENYNNIDEVKISIMDGLMKDFTTLEESAISNYDKIINKNFMYNHNKIIASSIDMIDKPKLIDFYKRHFDLKKYFCITLTKN